MRVLILILAATLAFAQSGPSVEIAAPVLGFGTRGAAVFPVAGLRAWPSMADALAFGPALRAVVAPRADYALLQDEHGSWRAVSFRGGAETRISASGNTVAISPAGTAAAFADRDQTYIVNGLPGNPRVAFTIETPADLISFAVTDDAAVLLVGVPGFVRGFRADGSEKTISAGFPAALAFLRSSRTAVIADSENHRVLSVSLDDGRTAILATGVPRPLAIAIDDESSRVIALEADERRLYVIPLSGGPFVRLDCDFEPARIEALRDKHLFLVWGGDGEARVLNTSAAEFSLTWLPKADAR